MVNYLKTTKNPLFGLGVELLSEFAEAELLRREAELRWLNDLRQYKGLYEPDEEAAMAEGRSRAFFRKTRIKVESVDARLMEGIDHRPGAAAIRLPAASA